MLASSGALPDGRADSVVSGRVVFGQGAANANLGASPAATPSTFRHAQGELIDDQDAAHRPAKPRKAGKLLALLGVAAAAAGIAYYLTQQQSADSNQPAAAVVAPAPVAVPVPKKVSLALKSDPAGAAVLRKDTNEQLGITPFDLELPASKTALELLFKKDGFRDKTESFVPEDSGQLAVALIAAPPPEKPPVPVAEAAPIEKPAAKPAHVVRRKPAAARHNNRAMDEDGVLAPSF
jgi:hypothetical protein